jgi:hypothetical protein
MIVASVLFAIAGLLALAAILVQKYQRKGRASGHRQAPPQSEPARLPRVVGLSNHGAQLLEAVENQRQAAIAAIHEHQATLERLNVEAAKIRAGIAGESALDQFLLSRLDDRWTLIAGYRAYRGEIDRILVGPSGVFAFEIKNLGGVIHCDGDRWWRDRTDRWGNVIEHGIPITDRGGRSPSLQLNDAADALEQLLRKNGHDIQVVRVVVFAHPKAKFGNIKNLSVNFLARLPGLDIGTLFSRGSPLSMDQARRIATSISRHHEWFERKVRLAPRARHPSAEARAPAG